ncbi:MAG: FHA domain-containing protein [Planctomycetes bacterium]|nr:FHA domain-containing protein [Planctomycetota bacterium]
MRLVVVEGKGKGTQVRLDQRQSLAIGRAAPADLVLDDPAVADLHVRLFQEATGWLAFDLTPGGFVHNGARAQRAQLAPGDTLQLGSHVLRLLTDDPVDTRAVAGPEPQAGAYLLATKGNDAGKTFPLGLRPAAILGRGVSTDITIWDIRASRAHARIDRQGDGYTITDLSSSNGTYVNDRRLKGVHPLAPGDVVRIGSTHLEFHPG